MKKLFISSLFLLSGFHWLQAQTVLLAGDIAFVGIQSGQSGQTAKDRYAFVLLKDITTNTEILFSDNAVLIPSPVRFCRNEGFAKWKATSNLAVGTVVSLTEDSVTSAGMVSGGLALSQTGDQILAMQVTGTDTVMLAGISSTVWETTCATTCGGAGNNKTCLPPNLADGVNSVSFTIEKNNAFFNLDDVSGSPAEILAAINNPANWTGADELQIWPTWSVSVVTSNDQRVNSQSIRLFPSNSNREFKVENNGKTGASISIYSPSGVLINSSTLHIGMNLIQTNGIPAGFYLANISDHTGRLFVSRIQISK